jgi:hypothetical protein
MSKKITIEDIKKIQDVLFAQDIPKENRIIGVYDQFQFDYFKSRGFDPVFFNRVFFGKSK